MSKQPASSVKLDDDNDDDDLDDIETFIRAMAPLCSDDTTFRALTFAMRAHPPTLDARQRYVREVERAIHVHGYPRLVFTRYDDIEAVLLAYSANTRF
jgi:hypothetical protein